jgi:hypothetical protein
MGYELDGRCSVPDKDIRLISTLQRLSLFWGSPSLLFNMYRERVVPPGDEAVGM